MDDLLIRNVRIFSRQPDGDPVDLICANGSISAIGSRLEGTSEVIDGNGAILIPAFTDAHAHLDSTRLGLPFRPHTAERTLESLIDNDRRNWRHAGKSVADRATHTLGVTIANGTTRVRTHAQVDPDSGLERLEGVLSAREEHSERATVEIVAFPQAGILREPGTVDLLDAAIRAGADLVGGIDPVGLDGDMNAHLDAVFGIAERHGVGVDIHLHDRGQIGATQIEDICRRAKAHQGPVNISHCFGLSTVPREDTMRLIELMSTAGVTVTTVAPGTTPPLPLTDLRDAGIGVGLGQDGIRDYWSPYGNGDMLDRTWQLAFTNGFRSDDLIEHCAIIASAGGASVMGIDRVGVELGDRADLVVVPGDTVTAAVMDRAPRSFVIREGRIVARDGVLV